MFSSGGLHTRFLAVFPETTRETFCDRQSRLRDHIGRDPEEFMANATMRSAGLLSCGKTSPDSTIPASTSTTFLTIELVSSSHGKQFRAYALRISGIEPFYDSSDEVSFVLAQFRNVYHRVLHVAGERGVSSVRCMKSL